MHSHARLPQIAFTVATTLALAGCDNFFSVEDTSVLDGGRFGVTDIPTLSLSARQDFATAYPYLIVYAAWFTGEAQVADVVSDFIDFERRDLSPDNGSLTQLWSLLSIARASNDRVLMRADAQAPGAAIHLARSALFSGYSYLFMAEHFCQGVKDAGPALTTTMMLDTASARFGQALTSAISAVQGVTGPAKTEAEQILGAALVGRARAFLQAGRREEAHSDAARVPADFLYELPYWGDEWQPARLRNALWFYTGGRRVLNIAPYFRGLDDPRVPVNAPRPGLAAFDGNIDYWMQAKYSGWDAPVRLASRIEADYIAAETHGTEAMLALIQARRAGNGRPPYAAAEDEASVMREFMDQRAREFFLEGKSLGDSRRHPGAVRYVPPPGAPYHKSGYAPIGSQTCYPLPAKETANNPNFP